MKKIVLLLLLFASKVYSQEMITKQEVFTKDSLVYRLSNSELFTGRIQYFKRKTHLTAEIEIKNGILIKGISYFNGKDVIVADETYYFGNYKQIERKIMYSLDHKKLWIVYYNKFREKILEEDFVNGIIVYSCPYLNNKKNGKVFSVNEKGEKNECFFENGKRIKK